MFWPCETRTSTCRSFATISSGLYRFLAIAVLLDVKDIPQVGPLQWGWIMSTSAVYALQWLLRFFCAEAPRIGDQHVSEPDDGIERGAQLVAHAGDELRLVLACLRQLPILVLNLVEQPHILDRNCRLVGEGLDQLDLLVGERPHLGARQCETPDGDPVAQHRNAEHGAKAA